MDFLIDTKEFLSVFINKDILQYIFGFIGFLILVKFGWPYIVSFFGCLCNTKKRINTLLGIADEFKNNHGSSLRDRVDAIYNGIQNMHEDIRIIDGRTHTLMNIIGDNNMSVGIYETDEVGNCIYVNNKWTELTGISLSDAQNYGWVNCIHPEDRKAVAENWAYSIAHRSKFDMIYKIVNILSQKSVKVRGYSFPIKNNKGQVIGFMGAIFSTDERCSACPALDCSNNSKQACGGKCPEK